ncbi:MAG: 30S ribosomal protein S2 [Acidobacteriota bacterium]|nr:30S ribosomal protein S2 [Thermoanaerobaculaceae bacterium]
MATISMKELLEAGVHFGHVTRKWNPKMKRYIFGVRNGIHIVDLQHTLREYKKADQFISDTVMAGGTVLFVGTKRQAQPVIQAAAEKVNMPYVIERWVGGMLTNFGTIRSRIERLKELDRLDTDPKFENLTKKEKQLLVKEREKLQTMFGGIREMTEIPSALFVVDIKEEKNCIAEARKLSIPVVAMVDTNCDPDAVDFPIPGNDDAVRSIQLFTSKIAEAVQEGLDMRESKKVEETEKDALTERLESEEKKYRESFGEETKKAENATENIVSE